MIRLNRFSLQEKRASFVIHMILSAIFMVSLFAGSAPAYGRDEVRELVVKIHAVRRNPDLLRPWTRLSPQTYRGTGVVIEGRRILTNAHLVRYASQIYVQPNQSADRIEARVTAIAPSMDLALLELEDPSFFDNRGFLPMAEELPQVKDTVNVYGYPTGGTELSVTEGIVSRIEFTDYYYSAKGLRIQVDAALNPGNSGGPAVARERLVGLVFSLIPSAQSIGYLIPVEEIRLFLEDVADGTYAGKPQMHDLLQDTENNALRKRLGLPTRLGGVMVTEPYREDGNHPLKEWDVITHIADQPIDTDGKVAVRYDLRLSVLYLLQKYGKTGTVRLKVYRNGESLTTDLPLQAQREFVIPYLLNSEPRYFIFGPLVFSQATQDYLERLGTQWELSLSRHASPLVTRRYDKPAFTGEELVVVSSPMFPHGITKGYEDPNTSVLSEVNGIRVKNLRHLVETLRDTREPQITFKFAKRSNRTQETLVFNREEIFAATEEILHDNGIRYQYSSDLRALWKTERSN